MERTFNIKLNDNWKKNTTLFDARKEQVFFITSEPKHIYGKWWHKILNKITFGRRFCEGWEHSIELISEK